MPRKMALVTSTIIAFFNRLLLKAPKNCVQKNGAKRRSVSSANWLRLFRSELCSNRGHLYSLF